MQTYRSMTVVRVLSASAAVLLLAGSTLAQERPRPSPSDTLRGPSVNDRAMPRNERFGDSMMEGRQGNRIANYRIFVASVKGLAENDNPRLKLTEDQVRSLTRIENAYQSELREYMQQSREQTQQLRERIREARQRAGDDREAVEQIMQRARARAQEIRAGAPSSDKAEAQMWEQLAQPQRRFVTAEIERRTREAMEQRMQQRERRGTGAERPTDRRQGQPDARPQRGTGATDNADRPARRGAVQAREGRPQMERPADRNDPDARRWAQLFERIQKLSPEQQERFFNMISSTLDRAETSEPEARRPQQRGPQSDRPDRPGRAADRDARPRRESRPGNTRD